MKLKKLCTGVILTVMTVGLTSCQYIEAAFKTPPETEATHLTIHEKMPQSQPESVTETESTKQPSGNTAIEVDMPDVDCRAKELLEEMTLEEKVGQMFIARCPETDGAALAQQYHLGGYVLFGRDFENKTKDQIIADIQGYQSVSAVPMFIAVDEEGGTVNRVSTNPNLRSVPFWASQDLYAEGGFELIASDTEEKCNLLESLGINLNLAPVCDISTNPLDYIYPRTFGQDADMTSQYVETVVSMMNAKKMGSTLKHFPGYGSNSDTHTGISIDPRSYDQLSANDFLPFQAGINAGATSVLVSHNVIQSIEDNVPASLSPKVHEVLREALNFQGIIMTDDLSMDAISEYSGSSDPAVLAVAAGNDLICTTDFTTQIPAVIEAVENGNLTESQIDAAVLRILDAKLALDIIE